MPTAVPAIEALLIKSSETQAVLRKNRESLAQRLAHLQKSSDCLDAVLTRRPVALINLLDEMKGAKYSSEDSFAFELFSQFDELLLEGDKSFIKSSFSPAVSAAGRRSSLLEKSQKLSILWASRDGFCNAYGRRSGEDIWKEIDSDGNCWETQNTLDEVLKTVGRNFDCSPEHLKDSTTIYHIADLSAPGLSSTQLLDDLRFHLNPAVGTTFDLSWDYLKIFVPAGDKKFVIRCLPSLGLGGYLKKSTGIDAATLLKKILLSDNDASATQLGSTASPAITAEEVRLHLECLLKEIQRLFPTDANVCLDGWLNAHQFRSVAYKAGYHASLPSRSNAITPWHRILVES